MVEVGGIEEGGFCNLKRNTILRHNPLNHLRLQLLFGFAWSTLQHPIFVQIWHKFGTKSKP